MPTFSIKMGVSLLLVGTCACCWSGEKPVWDGFSPYARELHEILLPDSPVKMTDSDAQRFLRDKGTRSATYLAVGLLSRSRDFDTDNAAHILRLVLDTQYNTPSQRQHGVWPRSMGGGKLDENWREFVGVGLIMAIEEYADVLDDELREKIDAALLRAAEGAARRNVPPEYTNIALMSAFLIAHTGARHNRQDLTDSGRAKALAIANRYRLHKTFSEYNSPTYYGVDLLGLALWRRYGPDPTFREAGSRLEADLWRDIAAFYHAGLRNMAGPYWRGYGMDMTRYTAVTGVSIALALNGGRQAPVPDVKTGRKSFEWNYVPLFAILNCEIPAEAFPSLKKFTGPRHLERIVLVKDREHRVEAVLEDKWMMGTATDMLRRWEQRCPAAIHWRTGPHEDVGWLLVRGENAASCTIHQRALQVRLPARDRSEHALRIQVSAPDIAPEMFESNEWRLPGMTLRIKTPLPSRTAQWTNDPHFGRVMEIRWTVPPGQSEETCVLEVLPVP